MGERVFPLEAIDTHATADSLASPLGAAQMSEHGQIERLQVSVQDPRVPMTHHASVGCCRVCGRCRVYTTSGDEADERRHAGSLPVGPDSV